MARCNSTNSTLVGLSSRAATERSSLPRTLSYARALPRTHARPGRTLGRRCARDGATKLGTRDRAQLVIAAYETGLAQIGLRHNRPAR